MDAGHNYIEEFCKQSLGSCVAYSPEITEFRGWPGPDSAGC